MAPSPSDSPYPPAAWLRQLQELLPPGRAWTREQDATLTLLLAGIAVELARVAQRAAELLRELDPREAQELLEEWIDATGVRDSFPSNPSGPTAARELANGGGQSIEYFVGRAAALGYEIEIEELRPFTLDHSRVGDHLYSDEARFVWIVRTPGDPDEYFRLDHSRVGDLLRVRHQADLEGMLEAEKPAHTHLIFEYV